MIAWILEHAGLNPGFLIGGVPKNFTESARTGSGPFFVIEADEYDTSYFDRRSKFLHYRPRTAVLNNLEYDHADIFPDLAAIQYQFHLLMRTIPKSGLIIHPIEDENLTTVFDMGCWSERLSFNNCEDHGENHADNQGATFSSRRLVDDASEFEIEIEGRNVGTVRWSLTGIHNVHNALAAVAAARHAGVIPELAIEALCEFQSVKRRMELIYETDSLYVYDDFAHHPSAISTTLDGLRHKIGKQEILAIIEPGSHTMKKGTHKEKLRHSASLADQVIWFEPGNLDWDFGSAVSSPTTRMSKGIDQIISWALQFAARTKPAHIIIMSNGSFGGLQSNLVRQLHDLDSGQ
jgi:UDP-N-acetylmuramate: L-alanyl-gamma-D-glutamyl-meso-diaminopimelate ligase